MKKDLTVDEAKRLSTDIISTLPQPIIKNILSLLPTREAAMTSILSREWRYKWTTLSTLKFTDLELHAANTKTDMYTYFDCIHKVLLSHQGQIHELYLEICGDCPLVEFDKLMLHLAKNHAVRKLKLYGCDVPPVFDFLISVFSLHHLTDLTLTFLELEDQTIFNVIGSITSLVLDDVVISMQSLLHLLSNCPSLNNLSLVSVDLDYEEGYSVEWEKYSWLENLIEEYSVEWENYSDVWLKNLTELEIEDFKNSKPEMDFVKFILARSPKLMKLSIKVREHWVVEKQKSKMLKALLQAPHASSVRTIIV